MINPFSSPMVECFHSLPSFQTRWLPFRPPANGREESGGFGLLRLRQPLHPGIDLFASRIGGIKIRGCVVMRINALSDSDGIANGSVPFTRL
jgi:hypothetical protein